METVYFRDFDKSENHAYDLYRALTACRKNGARRLVFEGGKTYALDPTFCFERDIAISNHGFNGPHRIAALIEEMEDFEIDFGGATLRLEGEATHIAILRSHRITLKNAVLENTCNYFLEAKVIAHGDGYIDVACTHGKEQFTIRKGELVCPADKWETIYHLCTNVEFNGETGELEHGTADHTLGTYVFDLRCEWLDGDGMRIYNVKRYPPIGNVLIISGTRRLGAGIFAADSSDITCKNITVHSCLGMGFIAEMCENIHLDGFATRRANGALSTACADATHFVDCSGSVVVENGYFEGQLDDALNIHGMYTRIVEKEENALLVREMHIEAKGIRIYRAGERIQVLAPDTLIPYTEKTITEVEYINADMALLTLAEGTADIRVGDDVENISHNVSLLFRHNTVQNNRARGMLIASRGKTVIEDCDFHTSGAAILFEANGDYWFESGGTKDVTIRNCRFDRCKYGGWGRGVIQCVGRRAEEEGKYFHEKIAVTDNTFVMLNDTAVIFDNVKNAVFRGNTVTPAEGKAAKVLLHHTGNADIAPGVTVETI